MTTAHHKGTQARGLMQVTPIAAKQVQMDHPQATPHPNLHNPVEGVWYGKKYLEYCQGLTEGLDEALACYNGGMGAVYRMRKGKPLHPETAAYIPKVKKILKLLEK